MIRVHADASKRVAADRAEPIELLSPAQSDLLPAGTVTWGVMLRVARPLLRRCSDLVVGLARRLALADSSTSRAEGI